MASTFVNDLRLEEMATGENSGSWGTKTNTNLELIAESFSYGNEIIGNADTTITMADGASDAARSFFLKITSSTNLTTTRVITLAPNTVSKVWMIENATSGSQIITITQGSGANVAISAGQTKIVATDGAGSGAIVYEMDDLDVGSYANFTKHVKKFRELKERHKRNMAFNKPIKAKKRSKTKIIMTPELKNRELPKNGKVKIAKAKKKGEIKNISGKSISRKKPL